MSRGCISLLRYPHCHLIRLENPAARNAMSAAMMSQLPGIVSQVISEKPAVVILSGDQSSFCSGGDLRDVRQSLIDPKRGREMTFSMSKALNDLSNASVYSIAAVEGAALGGGAELLTAMDYVIASKASKIGFVHSNLGVSPGWGGAMRLVQKIGKRQALNVLIDAQIRSPKRWVELGLVDELVESGTSLQAAMVRAETIGGNAASAIKGVLGIIKEDREEREVFLSLWGNDSHRIALGLKP